MGSINGLPSYTEYYGLGNGGSALHGIIFALSSFKGSVAVKLVLVVVAFETTAAPTTLAT